MNADQAAAAFWAAFLRNRNVDASTARDGAIPVAGGYALCVTATLIRTAIGAGSARPLREDDCTVVERFYAARSLPARFELRDEVWARDGALLAARGYVDEGDPLAILEGPVPAAASATIDGVAVRTTRDRRGWVNLLAPAMARPEIDAVLLRRTLECNAAAARTLVVASVDGHDVGGAALGIAGEFALFYSAGVLEPYRRRGVYAAMTAARIAHARALGAARFTLATVPDSPVERLAARFGLERTALRMRLRRDAA